MTEVRNETGFETVIGNLWGPRESPNELILENLKALDSAGAKTWIRCPVVPGLNDSDEDLSAVRNFVAGLRHVEKVDMLPYHSFGLEKYAKFGMEVLYPPRSTTTR